MFSDRAKRLGQRHLAIELVGVVRRRIGPRPRHVDGQRRVEDHVVEAPAQVQRSGIDEGLEGRTGLPHRLRRAVEQARALGVAPADHGTDGAVGAHHHDGGLRLGPVAHLVGEDLFQRGLGGGLHRGVEGGADHHILGRVAGQEIRALGHDPVGEIAADILLGGLRQGGGVVRRGRRLGLGQVALLRHEAQDRRRAPLRAFQIARGRVVGRRHQKTGQHRGLRGIQLGGGDPEIALRRALEAARAGAQIGAVEVDRQDLVLGIAQLHREGEGHLLDLAPERRAAAVLFVGRLGLPDLGS
jgi:hypothetical protein